MVVAEHSSQALSALNGMMGQGSDRPGCGEYDSARLVSRSIKCRCDPEASPAVERRKDSPRTNVNMRD